MKLSASAEKKLRKIVAGFREAGVVPSAKHVIYRELDDGTSIDELEGAGMVAPMTDGCVTLTGAGARWMVALLSQ